MAQERTQEFWSKHVEFFMALLSFAVGLGNVWRFPYLCYSNGGGAFLIPYFLSMVFLGIPIFYLEMTLGQFSGLDFVTVWNVVPLFRGVGISFIFISSVIGTYYNVIVSICIQYMYFSWSKVLPWTLMNASWNINSTTTAQAAEQFLNLKVLNKSEGFGIYGILLPNMIGSNFVAWLIVFLSLSFSIKSLGKVSYVTTIFPYLMITILVVRGATLPGSLKGIQFYLKPDFHKLSNPLIWKQASSQIFFSIAICYGGIITLSSHNKFNNSALRDSIVIPLLNCLTSFYVGFAVFSVMGYLSHTSCMPVDKVVKSGFGLAFVAYPVGLSTLSAPQFWSTLFFMMMTLLGIGSMLTIVEGVLDALEKMLPVLSRRDSVLFRGALCFGFFILGIPLTYQGGQYLSDTVDFAVSSTFLWIGFLELFGVMYIYGISNFLEDIKFMVGSNTNILWISCWAVISPCLILVILISDYSHHKYSASSTNTGAKVLEVLIGAFPLVVTFSYAVGYVFYKGGKEALKSPYWQPPVGHREGYKVAML